MSALGPPLRTDVDSITCRTNDQKSLANYVEMDQDETGLLRMGTLERRRREEGSRKEKNAHPFRPWLRVAVWCKG